MINDKFAPTGSGKISSVLTARDAWDAMFQISDDALAIECRMKLIRTKTRWMAYLKKNPRVWDANDEYVVARGRSIAESIASSAERRTHDTPIPGDVIDDAIRTIDAMKENIDDDHSRALEIAAMLRQSSEIADRVRERLIRLRDSTDEHQRMGSL